MSFTISTLHLTFKKPFKIYYAIAILYIHSLPFIRDGMSLVTTYARYRLGIVPVSVITIRSDHFSEGGSGCGYDPRKFEMVHLCTDYSIVELKCG